MTAHFCARVRVFTFATFSALALTMALTGCNMEAHESVDNPPALQHACSRDGKSRAATTHCSRAASPSHRGGDGYGDLSQRHNIRGFHGQLYQA